MAFIPCVDCADVVLEFTFGGVPLSIVLSAKKGGSITVTNLTNLGKAIIEGVWGAFAGHTIPGSNSLSLNSLKITDLTTASSPSVVVTNGTTHNLPIIGSDTGDGLTAQAAHCTTWQTGSRGRSFRGRSYYGGIGASKTATPDTFITGFAADMITFWDAVKVAIETAELSTWQQGIISRHTGGAPRAAGLFTQATGLRSNIGLTTQRRRVVPTG